ncbi:MAG: hypothetical protein KAT65_15435 [Methanophagales archaeon]|nr:hypothetical protein [Methanophagales archaeon]
MKKGDIVYFWLAGDPAHRGLYGWGVIFALYKALFEHEGRAYRVIVEYQRNFLEHKKHKHIPSEDIRKNPILRDLLIFRMPVGTNFLLTDEEDRALRGIIAQEFGEDWLPPLHSERGGV